MPSGSKPGERRGGRKKGTPNKRTQGKLKAEQVAKAQIPEAPQQQPPAFDSLDQKRKIVMALISLAAEESNKKASGQKWDPKWYRDCLDAANKAIDGLMPYEHRRLGQLGIDVEALMQRDGSLKVTISAGDADI